jgi:hypothetical protein
MFFSDNGYGFLRIWSVFFFFRKTGFSFGFGFEGFTGYWILKTGLLYMNIGLKKKKVD